MSELAGNLSRKFISFRHLGFQSSAHSFLEERESENPQTVEEVVGTSTVGVGETSNSPAKVMSVLQTVPVASEVEKSSKVEEDRELTFAEKDCVMTSSEEDMEDLSAFVAERLQSLGEGSVEKLIGEECVNVEEILCGGVDNVEGDCGDTGQSVCPVVTSEGDMDEGEGRFSPDREVDRRLREFGLCNWHFDSKKSCLAYL